MMVASPHLSYMHFKFFFIKWSLLAMLWAILSILERGVLVSRPSQGPRRVVGWNFFDHFHYFSFNFEHPELSLEGTRSTLLTCIVELVVMVASPCLSFIFFIFCFFLSSDACWPCSRLGYGYWGRGSWCRDPPKGPISSGGVNFFDP